ncbi:MAG: peptidoglycan-associated lipoprotein Pal [Nevskia sp.]|nr:peptidoglycan-associated lipoprotein Pal [Nevskia sp.]
MLHKNKLLACGAFAFALVLAGCSGSGETKSGGEASTANPSAGMTTSGGDNTGGAAGTTSGIPADHSVYFDFDKSDIKPEGQPVVSGWATYLNANKGVHVRIEGNCDERGTREYNIGLGERRANAVASALEAQGVAAAQLSVVSYGKERPVALGHDEDSWKQNRRADLVQQ